MYATSCAARGAFVPDSFTTTPYCSDDLAIVELKTIVLIATPNAVPTCVRVWKSAPPTDCSCGRHTLATKSVPVANTKSAPKTEMMAAGKPKAQKGADGSMTAKRRLASPVKSVPIAVGEELNGREAKGLCMGAYR